MSSCNYPCFLEDLTERSIMATGIDIARAFLEPRAEPPQRGPVPRRRFALNFIVPCAVIAAGGIGAIIYGCLNPRHHPVAKPGSRRYPPGYRHATD